MGLCINGEIKIKDHKRELSEDPKQQLFSAFLNNQRKQAQTKESDSEEDEQRRNPHGPIPAFTSIEIAKKLRYRSEERYINQRMEQELISYK